jgi:polyisoprenyl-teichoic acid--peptidoglycan teichoic acid transferase
VSVVPGGAPGAPRASAGMGRRFLVAAGIVALLAGAATATGVLLQVKTVVKFVNESPAIKSHEITPAEAGAPQTILVIGSDRRFKDRKDPHNARSDTIILVRMNPHADATTLMSIPRDLKVHLRKGSAPDKINAAYSIGGASATARAVKRVLSTPGRPFQINHIVNVNFGGFHRAVDALGCVYADIDRNYFNDNNPPAGGGPDYAVIDLKPGYQRMCGVKALEYVRFRHLDTDIIRSSRQQDFLRQAKQQYGAGKLLDNRTQLGKIFGRYTQSDAELHTTAGILKLLNLVIFSGKKKPIEEIHFPAILGAADDPFVTARRGPIDKVVTRFLSGKSATAKPKQAAKPAKGKKHRRKALGIPPGMVDAESAGEQQGAIAGERVGFPVLYPKVIPSSGTYKSQGGNIYPRAYGIKVRGHRYGAYRLVISAGAIGEYYGVQGTSWKSPPVLRSPSEIRTVNRRRLLLFYDGSSLRFVGFHTKQGAYWISNTLSETVPNAQMLAMAATLQRIGTHR